MHDKTNYNDEAIIKMVGKASQEFDLFNDLQEQIKLKTILEEVLYKYNVQTKETSLITSDIEEKVKIFFASKKLEGMSRQTMKNYFYILAKFSKYMKKPISTITTMDMRMYLALASKNIKATSMNALIYCFKSFFSWLLDNDYILKNPMNKIKVSKVPKRLRHALTEEEIELLKLACKTIREKALLEFLISSGCRLSEVVGINKSDINWNEMSLHVIGKGNKERIVYFSIKSKILLKQYLTSRKDDDSALFVSNKYPHGRLSGRAIEKELKRISSRTKCDKSIYPHLIRHTFATEKVNAGMPLNIIQELMGHENPSTTLIYAELSQENIKHEYKKIS